MSLDTNFSWVDSEVYSVPTGTAEFRWVSVYHTLLFEAPLYTDPVLEILFGEMPVQSTDLLFSGELYPPNSQIHLVFGQTGYGGVVSISGNSSITVGVVSEGFGEMASSGPSGSSDITVSVASTGTGAISIIGNGACTVTVDSVGTAEFSSYPEILGDGATTVTVTSTGTAAYDIFGDSTQTVTVTSTGTGVRQIDGNSSYTVSVATTGTGLKSIDGNGTNVLVTVLSSGTGVWTGGPEIFGTEGNTTVNLFVTGAGRIVNPIYGEANNTIAVSSVGDGTSQYIYVDIIGQGSSLIDVFTHTDGEVVSNTRDVFLIDQITSDYSGVSFEVYMLVDIDKKSYEIHSIKTNKSYLQDFRRFKWTKTMELGTVIKDEFSLTEEPSESYKTERHTTVRKYGASEIVLTINITDTYRFIKNEVNIAKLIDREVTRALLDTYALYELEFE